MTDKAKRDYAQERRTAIKRGETGVGSKSGDAQRHRARRIVEKRDGKAAVRGKDVGHKRSIKSGGSNASSNLRVESISGNRSNGGKSGDRAGKSAGGVKSRKGALSSS
ncbi:hypothetical protein ECBP2_0054 [Escherichia phage ECBP2]|uniref:Uncharacterized protein n=1 Tax=Escherichia phage ECBP2 TaxID=1604355 RepID=J9RVW6_9CAUD|nr:hypothetical protein ECBP2_0054 [Escherichia phage ECBP2]AFR52087.1 hypothetical protein ECBP2_0054 [Escherichia phage ECBP2]